MNTGFCTGEQIRPNPKYISKGRTVEHGITFIIGFERVHSAHSFKEFTRIVDSALGTAKRVWGWNPKRLAIGFHHSQKTHGASYTVSKKIGDVKAKHITLSHRLLAEFDAASIYRTLMHELCHIYRRAKFEHKDKIANKGHDEIFCRELGKVDPIVKNDQKACRYKKDKPRLPFKNMAPSKGFLLIAVDKKKRTNILIWIPNKGRERSAPMDDHTMAVVLEGVDRKHWAHIKVQNESEGKVPGTLLKLAQWLTKHHKKKFARTAAVLKQTGSSVS